MAATGGGDLWISFVPLATSFSALLVSRNAKHLLVKNDMLREDDRRQEIVKITHHLMATISSLIDHVSYFKTTINEKNKPALVIADTVENIVLRYEVLLEREPYKFLPGTTVDLIGKMSGSILGIKAFASGVAILTSKTPLALLSSVMPANVTGPAKEAERLLGELENLYLKIRELRATLDENDLPVAGTNRPWYAL
ncbi:hypothetical protein [Duganella aceris]|uniref:Uncharacterized protein n=1 Tax=Duganella aceris TaxID=2703883 RepID=A0ABX0FUR9_9BURK|nr:hypothetical protein [Duganella aceris]NGZ88148.1 hypothetical protein [Duganella aceris]